MDKIEVKMTPVGVKMESDRNEVALALKTWRLRAGLTQRQVGEMFGVSRYTIMRVEAASPVTWETAYRIFARLSQELVKEERGAGHE